MAILCDISVRFEGVANRLAIVKWHSKYSLKLSDLNYVLEC